MTHAAKIRALKPKTGLTHDDQPMTAEQLVGLLEELIDLKTQQHAEMHLKATPEIARLLQEKRETDRRRLEQIRRELIAALET